MTGRTTTLATEASTISQADLDRIHAEERLHAEQQCRTARVVAAASRDVEDCRMLLDMLGLDRDVVVAAKQAKPAAAGRRRSRAA